ncbi:MAG: 4Fe-4S dicluster domain-containing protein, partial [Pseudomonadota bacterium]
PRTTFAAGNVRRDVARVALAKLREHAAISSAPVDVIPLPAAAPYGRIAVATSGCTLCLSCVSACPTGAITDHPDRPQIAFTEAACVQCGLCAATCPETVISLDPRFNFATDALSPTVLKTEEPFNCVACGKAFGARSTIEAVTAKLQGHAMFKDTDQLRLIQMCDDCRIETVANADNSPFAGPSRPAVRTTDDYLSGKADEADAPVGGRSRDDFLS